MGAIRYALESRWSLRANFNSLDTAGVREAILAEIGRGQAALSRDTQTRLRRARTLDALTASFGLQLWRGGSALAAVFAGEGYDHLEAALAAIAPHSRSGSAIFWWRDNPRDPVVASITDGRSCAHLALPVDVAAAEQAADAAVEAALTAGRPGDMHATLWRARWRANLAVQSFAQVEAVLRRTATTEAVVGRAAAVGCHILAADVSVALLDAAGAPVPAVVP